MMPDKIYLTKGRLGVIMDSYHTYPIEEDGFENIEYIHKDALLEWAKSEIDKDEYILTLEDLIEKINSM